MYSYYIVFIYDKDCCALKVQLGSHTLVKPEMARGAGRRLVPYYETNQIHISYSS